ncbi:voltage-dependent T-type calcium channel subunit alpha-1G [Narcine bancroftii]|uniref:voltage-dependent T-type calcium channel subunit alpha-1G n=1 Tax=Narcine bancroftii TaxID=1343680 RepID=UPI0038310A4C
MLVILLNCVTLGMFQPCEDSTCESERCKILKGFDDFIFAFFAVEMIGKMIALGIFGPKCYLGDTWNRLDFFIVVAGMLEYSLDLQNVSLSAVRTVRVLRPLRAINRVPSMRILVTLLLDTLPMLGNVLLLCFFVFFIFGIVGVQLWAGLLRNRCFLEENFTIPGSQQLDRYYHTENDDENPFICSLLKDNGMRYCRSVPQRRVNNIDCTLDDTSYYLLQSNTTNNVSCVNWNQYYTQCQPADHNPFKGAINFDNIGYAWIAIFQVITLEGWVDIMYFVMDAHSFYNFIYFILLIIVGSFFMINLCLVVIATQFSETKQRESQLMKEQRVRFMSNASTLASFSEPGSCYDELLKYIGHMLRKAKREAVRLCCVVVARRGVQFTNQSGPHEQPRKRHKQKRAASVHHLIHHHHHHHHYHMSNGTLRASQPSPEISDVETNSGNRLIVLPSPLSSLHSSPPAPSPTPTSPSNTESVHSIYHANCHIEPIQCKSSLRQGAGLIPPDGLQKNLEIKSYPIVHPNSAHQVINLNTKGTKILKDATTNPDCTKANLNIPAGPYRKMHRLLETQSAEEVQDCSKYLHRHRRQESRSAGGQGPRGGSALVALGDPIDGHPGLSHESELDAPGVLIIQNTRTCTLLIACSSAFNTIIPARLLIKLKYLRLSPSTTGFSISSSAYDNHSAFQYYYSLNASQQLQILGLSTPLCNWILDFLTGTPQSIWIGNNVSSSLTINTDGPQGCVLRPLLYSLYTYDCVAMYNLSVTYKFANDSTVVGRITDSNEEAYRREIDQMGIENLVGQFQDHNFVLNVIKTWECIVDVRKERPRIHTPVCNDGMKVEKVRTFKFLGKGMVTELKLTASYTRYDLCQIQIILPLSKLEECTFPYDFVLLYSWLVRRLYSTSDQDRGFKSSAVYKEFVHSPRVCVGFLWGPRFLPTLLKIRPCKGSCKLSGHCLPYSSPNRTADILNCDPQSCPICIRSNETEVVDNETLDSESEGVYEFTQDTHYSDQRDPQRNQRGATKCWTFWNMVCNTCRKIVDSKYFGRGIMIAILINTLSMGIEYHEQPEELTNALEISNMVFTSLFALEMVLKILVYGPFGYIKNPYNIFDGIIVVISVWEIVGQQGGGLSVLRTFRLMRVLKLVRFMPALQRQLVVLMKTMDNVATFCMLLMLFIFIFSILGMHLFGCKFASEKEGDTLPDRKNFDSLLWAIVTVFQILTQEDWNKVLYNGMASTSPWAALYFIALMTFGNYVLFNLLVAILVEGFQTEEVPKREDASGQLSCIQLPVDSSGGEVSKSDSEADFYCQSLDDDSGSKKDLPNTALMAANGHLDVKTSLTPPLIIHTNATPMPTPKGMFCGDSVHMYSDSRRGSNVSIDPNYYDQKSPTSARCSPYAPWSTTSSWNSRRSSWNSLGRAQSLKRKQQSGERKSLLSGDGKESSDEGEGSEDERTSRAGSGRGPAPQHLESLEMKGSFEIPETLQVPNLRRSSSIHYNRTPTADCQDCNGKMSPTSPHQFHMDEQRAELENAEDEIDLSKGARLLAWIQSKLPPCFKERESWSLYLFPPQSKFRHICSRIISHKMFDHIVLVIIFLNCITIAMERPKIDPKSAERIFLTLSNYIFTVIFLSEMAVKLVAMGLCFGQQTYLKSSWNILDGLLVMISVIDILVSMVSDSGTKILGMLRVLRLLRTLRPLRVISRAPGLKLVVETLMSSLKPIGNIVVICCAFFIIFGILGVQLFKGKFYFCLGEDMRNVTNKSDCIEANYKWIRHKYNFDNLGQALMSLFVLASKDGWVDIMYDGLDAVGVDQQPIMNHNPWMLLYFISFLLIVAFFVLNMFVGVVVENFHKCRKHQEVEEAKRREEKRLRRMEKKRRSKEKQLAEAQCKPYYSDYPPPRLFIHKMCTSHYLDLFISIVIGLNVITMAMEHYRQPKILDEALKICNYIFTIIFVLESVFKLVAFGFRRFFKDRWNQLDLAIVLLSIMGITLEEIEVNASLPINPTIIRIMRVLRIARVLKLLKMAVGMRALLNTVIQALPQVGNLGLLFMLLFFIFAALGVELFGDLECDIYHPCEGLGRHATFRNFGMAFLTLFRVSTGDNWNGIMKDTLRDCNQEGTCYNTVVSPIYFVSFVLTAQFVLVNVVIAVLMKHLEESNKEAKEEAELEAELELELKMLNTSQGNMDIMTWGGNEGRDAGDSPVSPSESFQIKLDSPFSLEPPLDKQFFDNVSLLIQGSLEGELTLMDNLSGSVCHNYAIPQRDKCCTEKQFAGDFDLAVNKAMDKQVSVAILCGTEVVSHKVVLAVAAVRAKVDWNLAQPCQEGWLLPPAIRTIADLFCNRLLVGLLGSFQWISESCRNLQWLLESIKFLGVHLTSDLSWTLNISSLVWKAQQRLHFLRRPKRETLLATIMSAFCRSSIEIVLAAASQCGTVAAEKWFGGQSTGPQFEDAFPDLKCIIVFLNLFVDFIDGSNSAACRSTTDMLSDLRMRPWTMKFAAVIEELMATVIKGHAHRLPLSFETITMIPLAEMEAVSLTSDIQSEKSWSLALTDDSLPDDANVFLLNTLESNVHIPHQNDHWIQQLTANWRLGDQLQALILLYSCRCASTCNIPVRDKKMLVGCHFLQSLSLTIKTSDNCLPTAASAALQMKNNPTFSVMPHPLSLQGAKNKFTQPILIRHALQSGLPCESQLHHFCGIHIFPAEHMQEYEIKKEVQEKNLLTVRKPFVGRTHSLPNDSYMFQPVNPAPLQGLQGSEDNLKPQSGSTTSVRSQPIDNSGHLQVPIESFLPVRRQHSFDSENIPRIPPPRKPLNAHRMLRRQVAVTNDSLDPLYTESKENVQIQPNEPSSLTVSVPCVSAVQPSVVLVPARPSTPTKRSVHIQQHIPNQCNITNYVASPRHFRNPFRELPDSADQGVSQIDSSNKRASKPPMCPPLPTKICNSTGNLTKKDIKKFYSVDAQGFLAKPTSWLSDPRRHSIEICSSVEASPRRHFSSSSCRAIGQAVTNLDGLQAERQKQKMSPPCISIDPPESQRTRLQSPHGQTSSSDTCLRRRAPSCDSAPHRDSVDLTDPPPPESTPTSSSPAKDLQTLPSFSLDQTEADH